MAIKPATRRLRRVGLALLAALLLGGLGGARAAVQNPLAPPDTSGPRATLQSFLEATDLIYADAAEVLEDYARSNRLYPTAAQRAKLGAARQLAPRAFRELDLSDVLPALRDTVPAERVFQLREILDRITLPPLADIPDRAAMAQAGATRWRLPGTEIDIVLMTNGPRAGDYLFSAETVDRLPEFYQKIRDLPYKPGLGKRLAAICRTISGDPTTTVYETFLSSPVGLARVLPVRWLLRLPGWARTPLDGVTLWQWVGLALGLLISALLVAATHRVARRFARADGDDTGPHWSSLPVPVMIILLTGLVLPTFCTMLRIGGSPRVVIVFAATIVTYLAAAWATMIALTIVGELIVVTEHLRLGSLDSQLVRLGARLTGVVVATLLLIRGADALGFPAYSVIAGLGVGGLAVALAARDSIANLLGSLLIMFEKPFRIGDLIRVSGTEGWVEDVGFRSTRIRTFDHTLVSLPNSTVVNTMVENRSTHKLRRERVVLQVTYDTPRQKIEALMAAIRQAILEHPPASKVDPLVRFYNFNDSSLDILVIFHVEARDGTTEMREREAVLLRVMDVVAEHGVSFAFPTRTLWVETHAERDGGAPVRLGGAAP